MRAQFLFKKFKTTDFDINVCTMLERLFVDEPSLTEITKCSQCNTSDRKTFPLVRTHNATYNNSMPNIEMAIVSNFPAAICLQCGNDFEYSREYGQHIFVEISNSATENATDFEPKFKHKFGDIPLVLFNNQYVLHAAFLYQYGAHDDDIGHYTVAIKLNEKWEIYDDYKKKAIEVSNQHSAIIHALFYVKREKVNEKENVDNNASLQKPAKKGSAKKLGKIHNTINKRSSSQPMPTRPKNRRQ